VYLRYRAFFLRLIRYRAFFVTLASMLIASAFVTHVFGLHHVLRALERADPYMVMTAFMIGAIVQVLRGKRAAIMLSQDRPVTTWQSFSTMIVADGLGSLIPIVPGGAALRYVLTRRVTGVPVAFCAGVFMIESVLDSIGISAIIVCLLVLMRLPAWLIVALLGALVQSAAFLAFAALATPLRNYLLRHWAGCASQRARYIGGGGLARFQRWLYSLCLMGDRMVAGFGAVTACGWRTVMPVITLSLAMTALSLVRLEFLLRAFELDATINQVLIMMVLSGLVGIMPLKVPASGTWATTKLLRVVRLVGPGAGGFVIFSRLISSSESLLLALPVLGWWSMVQGAEAMHLGDLLGGVEGHSEAGTVHVVVE
jgi:uncharacterized membrane protein YbhN (UPF0104 family)